MQIVRRPAGGARSNGGPKWGSPVARSDDNSPRPDDDRQWAALSASHAPALSTLEQYRAASSAFPADSPLKAAVQQPKWGKYLCAPAECPAQWVAISFQCSAARAQPRAISRQHWAIRRHH